MTRTLARRRTAFLTALALSATMLLAVAATADAGVLKAGAHGRANIVDPAKTTPGFQGTSSGGLGAGGIAGSLAALALLVGTVGIVGRVGWRADGRDEALVLQPLSVSPASRDVNGEEEAESGRKAA
jgi:hypothetical protein